MPGNKPPKSRDKRKRPSQHNAEQARDAILKSDALQSDLREQAQKRRRKNYEKREKKLQEYWDTKDEQRETAKSSAAINRQKTDAKLSQRAQAQRAEMKQRLKRIYAEGVKGYDSWETGMAELFIMARDMGFMLSDDFRLGTRINDLVSMGAEAVDETLGVTKGLVAARRAFQRFMAGEQDVMGSMYDPILEYFKGRSPEGLKLEADIPSQLQVKGGKIEPKITGMDDNKNLRDLYADFLGDTTALMLEKEGYTCDEYGVWTKDGELLTEEDLCGTLVPSDPTDPNSTEVRQGGLLQGQLNQDDLLEYFETTKNRRDAGHFEADDDDEDEERDYHDTREGPEVDDDDEDDDDEFQEANDGPPGSGGSFGR